MAWDHRRIAPRALAQDWRPRRDEPGPMERSVEASTALAPPLG